MQPRSQKGPQCQRTEAVAYYAGGKRNVTVWRSSVRPFVRRFLTVIERAARSQRDSPWGSMRRGQRTFLSEYYEDLSYMTRSVHHEASYQ